jgi:chemotaxis protein methyltransferase CheR
MISKRTLPHKANSVIRERSKSDALNDLYKAHLSGKDFKRLSKLIQSECGIKMPAPKQVMLETKLRKRLRNLGIWSFSEYCNYLFSPEGEKNELVQMIDTVTTNKTDFFREPNHFAYLTGTAVPDLINLYGGGIRENLIVWSAGCATGEEPYSLAMALNEFKITNKGFQFMIIATDISTRVLEKARIGIYPMDRAVPIPDPLKKKYLLRSRDESRKLIRIIPALRRSIQFQRLNLVDDSYDIRISADIIFCRNVLIYFEKKMQEKIIQKICRHLRQGGYLFVGYSETLHSMDLPLTQVEMSVYKKKK